MSSVTETRRVTAAVIRAVSRGRRLDRALSAETSSLGATERRWAQELAYGVLRLRGRLDYLLDLHLRKGLSSVSGLLLDLLRQGAYQLLYMDGVPSYAVLDQTVEQVREVAGPAGARLANGVLRSLEREGGEVSRFPDFALDPLAHLATWGSHPRWMVERWLERWSPEDVKALVDLDNTPPALHLRPIGIPVEEAASILERSGCRFWRVGSGIPCLRLEDGINPASILEGIPGLIQDPGAALVTIYADPPPGGRIADLCAAPGGKALALASRGAYVLAANRSRARLDVLRENLARVGGRLGVVRADATAPPLREVPFLLLDVPCTGTGTLRRHPDAKWRLSPGSVAKMADLQRRMLDSGAGLVPVGGHLVYSTCTLEPEENELQVMNFLARHSGYRMEPTVTPAASYTDEEGALHVLPQSTGFDGAFGARLVRRS